MALEAINPPGAAWPGVSQGILGQGAKVFVSTGHVGTDASGEPVTTSAEAQIVALFENLGATLLAAGLGFEHVARVTTYVKSFDPEFLATFRAVRARYLNQDCPPAGVMVEAGLYDPRLLAEAEVLAFAP
ncbi:RidA family protein [Shinella daejeonensis]|uniref:RidA family protein n=1 Tax=Shinella daejeonensis TaxID=659017 RepID=UPI0020C7D106|nr:RidA family protein [Shinella daejeonensis]MCP8897458.1 RidA family protein [Shinella daejeonensis]